MTATSDERERRAKQSPTRRVITALAIYWLVSGASIFLMFRLCERCIMDNAYLGVGFLGMLAVILGVCFGLYWLTSSPTEGLRSFAAGAVPGVAAGAIPAIGVGAVIVIVGSTRMLLPSALYPVTLLLLIVGTAGTVAFASRKT